MPFPLPARFTIAQIPRARSDLAWVGPRTVTRSTRFEILALISLKISGVNTLLCCQEFQKGFCVNDPTAGKFRGLPGFY